MDPECPCTYLLGLPRMQSLDSSLPGPFLLVCSKACKKLAHTKEKSRVKLIQDLTVQATGRGC